MITHKNPYIYPIGHNTVCDMNTHTVSFYELNLSNAFHPAAPCAHSGTVRNESSAENSHDGGTQSRVFCVITNEPVSNRSKVFKCMIKL